jgi:hypothetical protein
MDDETEIGNLKRRLGDLEGAVKVLSGQMANIHPELVALGETTIKRFDLIAMTMDRLVGRLDSVNTQVWSLRDDMPALMADALAMSRKRID